MSKKLIAAAAVTILLLCLLIGCPLLVYGWVLFLLRTVPQVSVNPVAIISGTVFIVLLAVAIQGCCSSYCSAVSAKSAVSVRWRFRWSLVLVCVVVVMFVAALSTIGLARHVGWLFSSTDPTYKETVQYKMED